MAEFTAQSGEYPYAAMGLLIPQVAPLNARDARQLFEDGLRHLPTANAIHRTHDAFFKFLRGGWPVASIRQRKEAVAAGISAIHKWVQEPPIAAGGRFYFEYNLPQRTIRLDSEEEAHIFELLPFVDQVDRRLGTRLRSQYPRLQTVPVPEIGAELWRSAVFASAGHDTPERVERGFAQNHLVFLAEWAQQDARRALDITLSTKDETLRWSALALVLPSLNKMDSAQAESWLRELNHEPVPSATLVRANFLLGQPAEARKTAWQLWRQHSVEDLDDLQPLEDICGQYWFGDPACLACPVAASQQARYAITAAGPVRPGRVSKSAWLSRTNVTGVGVADRASANGHRHAIRAAFPYLLPPQRVVQSFVRNQFSVCAFFSKPAALQHEDLFGVHNRREAMRN